MNADPLEMIKSIWPKFQITKENLARPTTELVMRFYTHVLSELEEKINCWTDPYYVFLTTLNIEHLELEEQVFLRMFSLLKRLQSVEFKLCDIYEPIPFRTRSIFYICCHLITFGDIIFEDVEKLTCEIMKVKDNSVILQKKREELVTEIDELATKTSQLMHDFDKVKDQLSRSQNACEEMIKKKVTKEKIFSSKHKQLEDLKRQLLEEEHQLNKFENLEKILSEQVITEEEYKHLLTAVNNLEVELKALGTDDDNMEDLLVVENKVSLHYQECLKRIPSINDFYAKTVSDLLSIEKILQESEISNEGITNKITHLSLFISQKEKTTIDLKKQTESLSHEKLCLDKECNGVKMITEKQLATLKKLKRDIKSFQDVKIKCKEDMRVLQESYAEAYMKLSELDRKSKEYYRTCLMKYL